MQQSHRRPRRVAAFVAALPVASVLAVLPAISGATPALAATGDYSGSSVLDLIHANVDVTNALSVADAAVAPAESYVKSNGLAAPYAGKQSAAHSTNVNATLLGALGTGNLLVESTQTALPDNAKPDEHTLLPLPVSPILVANVATTSARARFTTEGCLPVGEPISKAITKVADAQLLPGAPGLGTVVATTGLNNGAATTTSSVAISAGSGISHRGLMSTGAVQVGKIDLLGGQIQVKVISQPTLTVEATGVPGGAKVTYVPAVLDINLAGTHITVDPGNPLPNPLALPTNPLVNLSIPDPVITKSAGGTSVSATVALLHLDVLSALPNKPLVNLDIGRTTAKATVPAGGIDCSVTNEDNPLREAHKDLSAFSVNPGQTFDYTVAVPNRGTADVTNVKVVDTVTPSGLELVKAVPSGTGTNPYTFDLGTIAANETKSIVMTFKVPATVAPGTLFHNHAHITGDYKGKTYTKDADVNGPLIDKPGEGACSIIQSNKSSSHLKVFTGETFNWYVHVFNTGAQACSNVLVTDNLESTVSFVSCTHGCTHVGPLVTWNVGTLAPGASTTLTVTVKTVATSGLLHNKAHITADGATPADAEVNGPAVAGISVLAPANPPKRQVGGLAFTGLSTTTTLLALMLLGLGLAVRRFSHTRRPGFRI